MADFCPSADFCLRADICASQAQWGLLSPLVQLLVLFLVQVLVLVLVPDGSASKMRLPADAAPRGRRPSHATPPRGSSIYLWSD